MATTAIAHPCWRLGLVVGFLGGFTPFSSFEWELCAAMHESFWVGAAYVVGSVGRGYVAV